MKNHAKILLSSIALSAMMVTLPAHSQTGPEEEQIIDLPEVQTPEGVQTPEEVEAPDAQTPDGNLQTTFDEDVITVTARKREETLTEVPVSISVLESEFIEDANIITQDELFSLVPGLQFDEPVDRNSASPSIRGIQSNEIGTNFTRVSQFIDGMPVLGSQGNIQFGGVQQVEVFRGPQSAAFGRSTFAGAINYVTEDPGDDFEAEADFDFDDYGRRRASVFVATPVTDTLGARLEYHWEDSTSPDEFIATDGVRFGERASDSFSSKLVWEPTDAFQAELTYTHVESADSPRVEYQISQDAFEECFDGTFAFIMGDNPYTTGVLNCDFDQGQQIISQSDRVPGVLGFIETTNAARAEDGLDPLTDEQVDNLIFLGESASIPDGTSAAENERDRFSLQVDYAFDNGSAVQASGFIATETINRVSDTTFNPNPLGVSIAGTEIVNGMGVPTGEIAQFYDITNGGDFPANFMAGPAQIEEKYAELRYVSPGSDRLRYVVGGSAYDYDFETTLFNEGFNAVVTGQSERYDRLLGNFYTLDDFQDLFTAATLGLDDATEIDEIGSQLTDDQGRLLTTTDTLGQPLALSDIGVINPNESVATPNQILSETASNIGVYGNVSYDFTDRLTGTFEARLQRDRVGGEDRTIGEGVGGATLNTTAFLPRVSFTYTLSDSTSFYGQYARGNNPAGVNAGLFSAVNVNQLDCAAFDYFNRDGFITDAAGTTALDFEQQPIAFVEGEENQTLIDVFGQEGSFDFLQNGPNGESPCGQNFVDFQSDDFQTFEEETLDNFEIGMKGELLDGRFDFAISAFHMNWNNQGRAVNLDWDNPFAGGMADFTNNRTFINEGDLTLRGVEFESTLSLSDSFSVRTQGSYLDPTYDDFCDVALADVELPGFSEGDEPFISVFDEDNTRGFSCVDVSGNTVLNQSKVTGSVTPTWRKRMDNGMTVNARADIRYTGNEYVDTANVAELTDTTTVNISSGITGDRWGLTFYVNNLFDNDDPLRFEGNENYAFDPTGDTLNFQITPRQQRTIGLRGNVRY